MKTTVIHHSADFDGLFCREIARKFLPDAELIGWDFADKPLPLSLINESREIYILDLPVDRPFGTTFPAAWNQFEIAGWLDGRIIWIDHHASSISSHPASIPGYRIDGVAACRLAWQWFNTNPTQNPTAFLPGKQEFVDRQIHEPWAVRLAGEYDIWDKRDPNAELFQHGLRSLPLTEGVWDALLSDGSPALPDILNQLLNRGEAVQYAQQQADAGTVTARSFLVEFEGLKFLALNTARCNSLTFSARDFPATGHDALMGFYWNGAWNVSLYHANHRKDLDLSQIAVMYGGGGHRGACGFRTEILPFINNQPKQL